MGNEQGPDPFRQTERSPVGRALRQWPFDPAPGARGPSVLTVGEVLDDTFELLGVLGEGGMGQVFDAYERPLHRRVAIKVSWPHVAPDTLKREAQALAQVHHPSIIAVHALRRLCDLDYLVMERVWGISVERHIARLRAAGQPFTVEEALDVLIPIAEGLEAIHGAGLTHRDIKPANVMLAVGDRVVLMDFGLVVPGAEAGLSEPLVTGSPAYMAPESIRGAVQQGAAHLVDLYAVGVLAFEVLTGETPFVGSTVGEVLQAHLSKAPPSVRERRPEVCERLSALVARLLAKDWEERPQSAAALLAELHAIRDRRSQSADDPFSVLIADDDAFVRDVLRYVIQEAVPDAKIELAGSGAEVIERVRAKLPDVLVLDLQMPDINGVEVCMYLRGTHLAERCRIVLVSGDADPRDVTLLRQLGVGHYLPKSGDLHEKLQTLLRALRDSRPPAGTV